MVLYRMMDATRTSLFIDVGYPQGGAQDFVLPEPPRLTSADPIVLADELQWQLNAVDEADETLWVRVGLGNVPSQRILWVLRLPPGSTSFRMPELPSDVEPESVLGADNVLVVQLCEPSLPQAGPLPLGDACLCRRLAGGRMYPVEP